MNRKLISWATLTDKNDHRNNNCSLAITPQRLVIVSPHTCIASAAIVLRSESHEFHMAGCIIKRRVEWSLPEVHRKIYKEVINHF